MLLVIDPKKVRNRIKQLDLKHEWVANEVGIAKSTLTRWLRGDITRVREERVNRLAAVLDSDRRGLLSEDFLWEPKC